MNPRIMIPIFIVAVVWLSYYLTHRQSLPDGYSALSAAQAYADLAQSPDVRILDIRTPAEFAEGHIQNAENLDFYARSFEADLGKLDRNGQYFVYCRSGNRSSKALRLLQKLGFTRIWHMSHGINDWKREGLPLVQ